jgi:hypothetical protein
MLVLDEACQILQAQVEMAVGMQSEACLVNTAQLPSRWRAKMAATSK